MARWIPWNYKAVPRAIPAEHGDQHAVAAADPIPGVTEGGVELGGSEWGARLYPLPSVGQWYAGATSRVYPLAHVLGSVATANISGNQVIVVPFILSRPILISALSIHSALNSAAVVGKLGIYDADEGSLEPTALLGSTPQLDFSTIGIKTGALVLELEKDKLYYVTIHTNNPGAAIGTYCALTWTPFGTVSTDLGQLTRYIQRQKVWDGNIPNPFPAVGSLAAIANTAPVVFATITSVG